MKVLEFISKMDVLTTGRDIKVLDENRNVLYWIYNGTLKRGNLNNLEDRKIDHFYCQTQDSVVVYAKKKKEKNIVQKLMEAGENNKSIFD